LCPVKRIGNLDKEVAFSSVDKANCTFFALADVAVSTHTILRGKKISLQIAL